MFCECYRAPLESSFGVASECLEAVIESNLPL